MAHKKSLILGYFSCINTFLQKVHCFDCVRWFRNKVWDSPQFLIKLISLSSIVTIFISLQLFSVSEKLNDLQFSTLNASGYRDRFISKNDNVILLGELSRISKLKVTDMSLLKQAYKYYLAAKDPSLSDEYINEELKKITSLQDYQNLIGLDVIEEINAYVLESNKKTFSLREDQLFWLKTLILIQIINMLFTVRLAKITTTKYVRVS
ncbi:hypothetical protein A3A35_02660 [Candidatus Kaiserbacteria bacterium RIFCSPLOWO2_01_FULL_51_21]|uniref:Uncharacterized protein n=1 Tax=Candidatus Kaiserbacteria bacterium RIFCSPLOWO2_01_FULL_51_21 TaxID=1798508 RepID=A0A1F6EDQ2_9BACT|nr:MAG: hypothetical protein A3A35_02660 [Candidatus Kaiserbacteria bacterium RIFCSPLOWO2_01_FULL_51_21]